MEQLPVRSFVAGLFLATMVIFTGTLSFRLTGSRLPQPAPAVAEAAGRQQAPAISPKPVSPSTAAATPATAPPTAPTSKEPNGKPTRRYTVQQGDSLWELASRYGLSLEAILASNPQVYNPGHLQIGQAIILPASGGTADAVTAAAKQEPKIAGAFSWPVFAPISSPFGPRDGRNHNGLDLAAQMGDPIKAARDGEVILAGPVSGYGQTIILMHEDGTRTLYAHASRLLVQAGERVRQGEVIAEVGSTGHSTGPHLHFEIIVNNKPLDPILYLPRNPER
ncbi:MAG TPA: peptidoglycan DD-metalloendopeptidase family protein [Symbiobacteriaceae bacterium]|nr:peptidoglycan DD-metalloendopeptidase family protein [Symbiobacteriaceae bacterium]